MLPPRQRTGCTRLWPSLVLAAGLPISNFLFLRNLERLPPVSRRLCRESLEIPMAAQGDNPSTRTEQLEDVLCDFPDVFSTSKTDFGSCSLMPFEVSVPEGSAPVTSRPHRINPILAK